MNKRCLYSAYKSSGSAWLGDLPVHWEVRRLRTVAEMRVSNVDKRIRKDETPIRLCNYVDVYKNDWITQSMPFMNATASENEIRRFRLQLGDVLITKDSETWDDIGVPALVTEPADDLRWLSSGLAAAIQEHTRSILGPCSTEQGGCIPVSHKGEWCDTVRPDPCEYSIRSCSSPTPQ